MFNSTYSSEVSSAEVFMYFLVFSYPYLVLPGLLHGAQGTAVSLLQTMFSPLMLPLHLCKHVQQRPDTSSYVPTQFPIGLTYLGYMTACSSIVTCDTQLMD